MTDAPYGLPAATRVGRVRLRVKDLERSLAFYCGLLGLRPMATAGRTAQLSATGGPPALVVLEEDPAATPKPPRTTGLYHFAILFPDRPSLARAFLRLYEKGWPFQGFSDHLVSEAIYLADPDGNGIEIYTDRPRSTWRWQGGQVQMATVPLNLRDLVATLGPDPSGGEPQVPPETTIGHIHLHVASLAAAERFYAGALGFAVTARNYPGALFLAAGGYHHHLGTNIWAGAGAPPPPPGCVGLLDYALVLPSAKDLDALVAHLRQAGHPPEAMAEGWQVRDPDGVPVILTAAG